MPQGACITDMAEKKSAYKTFYPWTTKIEEPSSALCQSLISLRAGYPS